MSWLTDGSSKRRCCCFKRRREGFFLFPSPTFSSLFYCFFSGFPFILPVCCQVSYPVSSFSFLSVWVYQWFSFVRFVLSPRFVFCFSPFPLRSFSQFVLLPLRAGVKSLFIGGKGAGPHYGCVWGRAAPGWVSGRGWQGAAPLISHHQGAWGFGSLAEHAGRERGTNKTFYFFPCCTSKGRRKRNSVVQNDIVPVFFFF